MHLPKIINSQMNIDLLELKNDNPIHENLKNQFLIQFKTIMLMSFYQA